MNDVTDIHPRFDELKNGKMVSFICNAKINSFSSKA